MYRSQNNGCDKFHFYYNGFPVKWQRFFAKFYFLKDIFLHDLHRKGQKAPFCSLFAQIGCIIFEHNAPAGRARSQFGTLDRAHRYASENRPVRYLGGFHRLINCRIQYAERILATGRAVSTRITSTAQAIVPRVQRWISADIQIQSRRCPRCRRPGCPSPPAGRTGRCAAGSGRSSSGPRSRRS